MFVMYVEDMDGIFYFYVMINFEIVGYIYEEIYLFGGEGCFLVDCVISGLILRYYGIMVRGYYFDFESLIVKLIELILEGYFVIVF